MSHSRTDSRTSATALREAFDAGFAAPRAPTGGASPEDFVAFRAHGQPFALAVAEIAGLYVDRKIVVVPARAEASFALLGVAALRGVLTPVYDLGRLLGVESPPKPAARAWRWMVVAQEAGFAFEVFEAHVRARREDLLASPSASTHAGLLVSHALSVDGVARPLVNLGTLLATLKGTSSR